MKYTIGVAVAVLALLRLSPSFPSGTSATGAAAALSREAWPTVQLDGLDAQVFLLALQSASAAVERGTASLPSTLTVIDYSKPSTEPRMWVFDVRTHELLFHELVS